MVKLKKRVSLTVIILIVFFNSLLAQSFSTANVKLYDYFNRFFIQEIPIVVTDLPEKTDNFFGLEKIKISLHHGRVSDLKIQIQSPDGNTAWITNRNGGTDGENYVNTTFEQYGKNGLINAALAPFTGSYTPDGEISIFNNSEKNPNGEWKLLIEDLREDEEGFLDSVSLIFGEKPAFITQRQFCNFDNPQFCVCRDKLTNELLPDLVIVPQFAKTQYKEFAWNDAVFPGQLKIAVAIANIGYGPLEVVPDTLVTGSCCGADSLKVIDEKRYPLYQKIYSKKENIFFDKKVKSGTIYFESKPGHQHYHVDDWIEMRLVKVEKNKKIIVCKGQKVSYCLFTTGMLYEKDSSSLINGKFYGRDMPNYSLGNYFACSFQKQGISVGGYDYYGMMYEGQFLRLPKALKNGEYVLEIEIDPQHKYKESNKKNNIFRMPILIRYQNI